MKLVTLNLEGDKHLDVAIPFLVEESSDIVCLQEVFEPDAAAIAERLGAQYAFVPMTKRESFIRRSELYPNGIAILSRYGVKNVRHDVYYSKTETTVTFDRSSPEAIDRTMRRILLLTDVAGYTIGTTHFNWTPDGLPDTNQEIAMTQLLTLLESHPSLIMCGDFNIPRHVNALYERLTQTLVDAVPHYIRGSLDVDRHRVKDDPAARARLEGYMVDYILHTKNYSVQLVRKVCGVSDHCAMVGEIAMA